MSATEQHNDPSGAIRRLATQEASAAPQRQLARVGGRYEDFLRSAVDWLWETDARLNLTYASSPIALNLGIPAQVLVGRPMLSLGRFERGGGREQQAEAAIEERRPFRTAVFLMAGADNREVAYHLSGVPYFEETSGRFAGYRGTATAVPPAGAPRNLAPEDGRALVTALEEALLRQQDLSWRLSRATAEPGIDQAPLARTAHELRTPLNAITGYADLALKKVFGELGERYLDCFRTIHEAGRHMDQLVAQLEHAGRPAGRDPLASEIVHVGAVAAKAKAIVALAAKAAEVDIGRVGPMAGGRVIADRLACTQILVNLLNNAVKFTPAGGSVGLETLVGPANRLHIVVWDTGIGISEEDQKKIFEPAYRVSPREPAPGVSGLGLGLAISRDLARAMGGDISVSSVPGNGSRFTLSLPLAGEPETPHVPAEPD
ncbi:MAG: PAS domain-containing sensor histidine kinase [Kiloniellaceae bacterium]